MGDASQGAAQPRGLPFRLVEVAGEGRLGPVWKAEDPRTGRPVAVRFIAVDGRPGEELRRAVRAEYRRGVGLDHPGILALLDRGELLPSPEQAALGLPPRTPWVAWEWAPHRPLAAGRVRWSRLRPVVLAILDALGHIHARGITHGAIHAGNVVAVEPDGPVRLADLGAGRVELVAKDLTDHGAAPAPFQEDFAALGTLVHEAAGPGAPRELESWISRMRRRVSRPAYRHAAEAAEAFRRLDAPGGPGLAARVDPPPPAEDWRRPGGCADRRRGWLPAVGEGSRPVPLVGRDEERALLWATLRTVHAERRPRVVLLQGPEGVGKWSLVRDLALRAAEQGVAWRLSAWYAPVPGPDLGLVPMLARFLGCSGLPPALVRQRATRRLSALGVADADTRERIARLLTGGGAGTLEPGERGALLREALAALARRRSLVLGIRDVQWGVEAVEFLEGLFEGGGLPVLVACTLRPELLDRRPDVAARIARLLADPEVGQIDVGPLEKPDMMRLLEDELLLGPDTARSVAEASAGRPLMAVQLTRDLAESGALAPRPDGRRAHVRPGAELPTDVEAVWMARLGRVLAGRRPDDAAAVELAAILGGIVAPADWEDVGDAARVDWSEDLVDALLDAGLAVTWDGGAPGSWAFVHGSLVRTVVRRAVRARRAAAHHRACAAVIEARLDRGVDSPHESAELHRRLVRHLVAAGSLDDALAPLLRGIRGLVERGEGREAAGLLDSGRPAVAALANRPADPRWGELHVLRAEVAWLRRDREEFSVQGARAEVLARRWGWSSVLAHALLLRARVARYQGHASLASRRGFEAERLARELDEAPLAARARLELGRLALEQGEVEEAGSLCASADAALPGGRPAWIAGEVRLLAGAIALARGRPEEAREAAAAAVRLFEDARRRVGLVDALVLEADAARMDEDLDAAEAALARARETLGARVERPPDALLAATACLEVARRDPAAAGPAWMELLAALGRTGHRLLAAEASLGLACAAAAADDWAECDLRLDAAREILAECGFVHPDLAFLGRVLGDLAHDALELRRARRAWRLSLRQCEALELAGAAAALRNRLAEDG